MVEELHQILLVIQDIAIFVSKLLAFLLIPALLLTVLLVCCHTIVGIFRDIS